MDIKELRQKWVLPRVERVTTNTFKLYQVREQLKKSKVNQSIMIDIRMYPVFIFRFFFWKRKVSWKNSKM